MGGRKKTLRSAIDYALSRCHIESCGKEWDLFLYSKEHDKWLKLDSLTDHRAALDWLRAKRTELALVHLGVDPKEASDVSWELSASEAAGSRATAEGYAIKRAVKAYLKG